MTRDQQLLDRIRKWQEPLLDDYLDGSNIIFEPWGQGICSARSAYAQTPGVEGVGRHALGIVPTVKAIVVGLDIREYSLRTPEEQLFLTLNLHSNIRKAKSLLERTGILHASGEPRVIVQTGDGAYVVFSFIEGFDPFEAAKGWQVGRGGLGVHGGEGYGREEQPQRADQGDVVTGPPPSEPSSEGAKDSDPGRLMRKYKENPTNYAEEKERKEASHFPTAVWQAFSFVFTVNVLMNGDNTRQNFRFKDPRLSAVPAFPVECRFAMSYEDVLLLRDINDNLNCVGKGMVTCNRILSTDHGSHFLIQEQLLNELARHGGLIQLGGGLWENRLHQTLLEKTRIKDASFRYANVFGFYRDGPLLPATGRVHDEPRTYQIGSHDCKTIDTHS